MNDQVQDVEPTDARVVTGIILAGGKSRRMGGINKALLRVGRHRIIERVCKAVLEVMNNAMIITNAPDDFAFLGLPMFPDIHPNTGSLGGLYTGLKHCTDEPGFLVACDMPFLDPQIMRTMIDLIDGYDVVIPNVDGGLQPLHAIYSKNCTPLIADFLLRGNYKIIDFLDQVKVREVPEDFLKRFDPTFRFVMNINNPEDLAKALYIDREPPTGDVVSHVPIVK
jgi:molybdopterin-guanine dinucleotide biosynthesis protein A